MSKRILIVGGPRTGKTTLSRELQEETRLPTFHTDDFLHLKDFRAQTTATTNWLLVEPDYIVEGVHTVYALRRLLEERYEGEKPAPLPDLIHFCEKPFERLHTGQERLWRGVNTVMYDLLERFPDLRSLTISRL